MRPADPGFRCSVARIRRRIPVTAEALGREILDLSTTARSARTHLLAWVAAYRRCANQADSGGVGSEHHYG